MGRFGLLTGSVMALSLLALPAHAQDETKKGDDDTAASKSKKKGGDESSSESGAAEEPTTGETVDNGVGAASTGNASADAQRIADATDTTTTEKPGRTYYFVGWRYRGIFVPKFMEVLFGADSAGGANVYVNSTGPEFGIRKDNFEYNLSLWWAGYYMSPTPFKGKNDGPTAWEKVESDINMIAFTADLLWTIPFSPEVGFNYGLGFGVGFPFGPLKRTELYPGPGSVQSDPSTWSNCTGAGQPDAAYCEKGPHDEPNWFDGGSKPIIFPWLAFDLGFRFKPHRNFAARIDAGFGTSGFLIGVGADYGL